MHHPAFRGTFEVLFALLATLALACTAEENAHRQDQEAPLYVAIGASDSVGTGARNPTADGWVAQVHRRMPAGTRLANLGIGGLQTQQALDQVLPVALDLQPTVITIWLAVNDYAAGVPLGAYHMDLDLLVGALAQGTEARLYVANMPDLTLLPRFQDRPPDAVRADVARWNAAIADVAAAHGATLIDLYTGWAELRDHPDYISRDGLHPSSRGHRRLAEIFWEGVGSRE
jgi:lysophospholipase L1-like esterase